MSILTNEKVKAHLAVVNGKVDDGNSNGPDFFSEVFKTDNQNHLSFHAGALTPKVYNPGKNNITADEALNKLLAETAMVAVKEMMKENNIPPEMLPDDVLRQIIADNIDQNEIDKQLSKPQSETQTLMAEAQTLMAEAFREANENRNRNRNRNRGRGHRE